MTIYFIGNLDNTITCISLCLQDTTWALSDFCDSDCHHGDHVTMTVIITVTITAVFRSFTWNPVYHFTYFSPYISDNKSQRNYDYLPQSFRRSQVILSSLQTKGLQFGLIMTHSITTARPPQARNAFLPSCSSSWSG
jgi:hypothetical protein